MHPSSVLTNGTQKSSKYTGEVFDQRYTELDLIKIILFKFLDFECPIIKLVNKKNSLSV